MTGENGGAPDMEKFNQTTEKPASDPTAKLRSLLQRAEQGDASVLPAIRYLLDENEAFWKGFGDVGLHAEASLILLASGSNLLLSESIRKKLEAIKTEVGGR